MPLRARRDHRHPGRRPARADAGDGRRPSSASHARSRSRAGRRRPRRGGRADRRRLRRRGGARALRRSRRRRHLRVRERAGARPSSRCPARCRSRPGAQALDASRQDRLTEKTFLNGLGLRPRLRRGRGRRRARGARSPSWAAGCCSRPGASATTARARPGSRSLADAAARSPQSAPAPPIVEGRRLRARALGDRRARPRRRDRRLSPRRKPPRGPHPAPHPRAGAGRRRDRGGGASASPRRCSTRWTMSA